MICLLPIGEIQEDAIAIAGETLREVFGVPVRELRPEPLPSEAFDPERNQYHSTSILLKIKRPSQCERLLGIVDVDLYVPGLNFVFGEASPTKGVAIVSLTRLRQEFYGLPPNRGLFLERLKKEAVHEIGHTFGLGHCNNPGCVMSFSNSLIDTDRKSHRLCQQCRRLLSETGGV